MLTKKAVGSLVGALRSLLPRDAAEEPETLEVLRVQPEISESAGLHSTWLKSAVVQSGVNNLLSQPNGPALRA